MGCIEFTQTNVQCVKYADDVTLIESLSHNELSSVSLDECVSIFKQEGLFVNRLKCKQLHICFCRSCCSVNDVGFAQVSSLKILGFVFCDRFTWDSHISSVLKTASQRLHIIRCMKTSVTPNELKQIYHALIVSLLCYASPTFGLLPSTLMTKLEKFQRRAHRLICDSSCKCSAFPPRMLVGCIPMHLASWDALNLILDASLS